MGRYPQRIRRKLREAERQNRSDEEPEHYQRHCGDKVAYGYEAVQLKVIDLRQKHGPNVVAYECIYCKHWHTGHRRGRKGRKPNRAR